MFVRDLKSRNGLSISFSVSLMVVFVTGVVLGSWLEKRTA